MITNKPLNRLTQAKIKNIKSPIKLCDGGGLWIVAQAGRTGLNTKWVFRYKLFNINRNMGLGSYPDVTLAEAREKASEYRALIRDNIDPIDNRNALKKQAQVKSQLRNITFEICAKEYISAHSASWKNEKHKSQWENTLKDYAYPVFKNVPVEDIDIAMVIHVLEPIWANIHVTAQRLRQRIKKILDWATVKGYRKGDNPAEWKDRLDKLLPDLSKKLKVRHHPAMPYQEVPTFIAQLITKDCISARALLITIMTALRTSESIGAVENEFDFENNIWTIPSDRMKGVKPREHRVPLPTQAIPIIKQLLNNRIYGNEYLFPGNQQNKPISKGTMHAYLKHNLGYKEFTVHGFRSSFRDWASETTNYPDELGEACLAHVLKNKVQAAYQRGDLLDRRRQLMQEWADFIFSEVNKNKCLHSVAA